MSGRRGFRPVGKEIIPLRRKRTDEPAEREGDPSHCLDHFRLSVPRHFDRIAKQYPVTPIGEPYDGDWHHRHAGGGGEQRGAPQELSLPTEEAHRATVLLE